MNEHCYTMYEFMYDESIILQTIRNETREEIEDLFFDLQKEFRIFLL